MGENQSFEEMAQVVVDYIVKERNDATDRHLELEKANNELRLGKLQDYCLPYE